MGFKNRFLLDYWNVGIVESGLEDIFEHPGNMKISWVQHRYRDRFFADPFLYDQDQKYYYIYAEEFIFCERKGRISCLTVDKRTFKLLDIEVILNEPHHLSYPFIFGEYIIPEGYRSGACYAYKKVNGGQSYQRIKISDMAFIDSTVLKYNDKLWLFATTKKDAEDAIANLRIYVADQLGKFSSHAQDPVKTDNKTARPGGAFFEYQGKLYRPVQDCAEMYGHYIRIMEVKILSEQEYEEQEVMVLSSTISPPYNMRLHTFNAYEGCIVVDGYLERYSFLKPCLKMLKKPLLHYYNRGNNRGKEIVSGEECGLKNDERSRNII